MKVRSRGNSFEFHIIIEIMQFNIERNRKEKFIIITFSAGSYLTYNVGVFNQILIKFRKMASRLLLQPQLLYTFYSPMVMNHFIFKIQSGTVRNTIIKKKKKYYYCHQHSLLPCQISSILNVLDGDKRASHCNHGVGQSHILQQRTGWRRSFSFSITLQFVTFIHNYFNQQTNKKKKKEITQLKIMQRI